MVDRKLVIEATLLVTGAVGEVWTGIAQGGEDPTRQYACISGLNPLPGFSGEAG